MRYSGGKHFLKKELTRLILPTRGRLVEPFCGGLSATVALQPTIASDASKPLMALIEAVRSGWEPPFEITKEMYNDNRNGEDALAGFLGHGCSWGGKWFGGYADPVRDGYRNYARQSFNALKRKIDATRNVEFICRPYWETKLRVTDTLYCDPPYKGTAHGYATDAFDSDDFWRWVQHVASLGVRVYVSEYTAPDFAKLVAEFPKINGINGLKTSTERLYLVEV